MDDIPALIKRLEAGLEGVTPGPWYSEGTAVIVDTRQLVCCGKGTFECCGNPDIDGDYGPVAETSETAARHIANCDPDTIRTLLSALQAQAAEIDEYEREMAALLSEREVFKRRAEAAEAKLREAVEVMRQIEPYLDAIVNYADTMDEYEPNRIAYDARAFLAKVEPRPVTPDEDRVLREALDRAAPVVGRGR